MLSSARKSNRYTHTLLTPLTVWPLSEGCCCPCILIRWLSNTAVMHCERLLRAA